MSIQIYGGDVDNKSKIYANVASQSKCFIYIIKTSTLSRIVRSIILLLVSMYICYVHLNTTHNGNPICANFQNMLKQDYHLE